MHSSGLIETFPYVALPTIGLSRDFTQHRLFRTMQLAQKEVTLDLSYRFMLEQRFEDRYSLANVKSEDGCPFYKKCTI